MPLRRSHPPRLENEIATISPSLAAKLESCPLAAVFSRDRDFLAFSRRGSHFAALGEICHVLWEREGRGEFDEIPDDALAPSLNRVWDEVEAGIVLQLTESLDGVQPPPPRQWPDYLTKRLGVIALIKNSVRERRTRGGHAVTGQRPLIEDPIEIPGIRLRGRPDRVLRSNGASQIIDLKTCSPGESMNPEHRRQLLAYAYLFHAKYGEWPGTAAIQYVGGERRVIDVQPDEAEEVAAEMIAELERVNSISEDFESLARPSPITCRWCMFKAACEPFFLAVGTTWEFFDRYVLGVIDEIDPEGARSCVTLRVSRGNIDRDFVVVVAADRRLLEGLNTGEILGIAGARATQSAATIRCAWSTVVCAWEDRPSSPESRNGSL